MKVLIIRNYPSYMSVTNRVYNIQEIGLAQALRRRGIEADVLLWTDKEEETVTLPADLGGEVSVFYRKGITCLKNVVFQNCERLFARYDILQSNEYNQRQAWLLAKKYPEKTIIYHGPYYSDFNRRYNAAARIFDCLFLKQYIRQGTHFLTKSELARQYLLQKGIAPECVCTVGVGVDSNILTAPQDGEADEISLQMQQDSQEWKLLYIGRLEKRRNIPFLLDILSETCKRFPNVRLYMVGTGDDDYVQQVFEYAAKLGVKERIVWQKKMLQKKLSQVYRQADFFLLPTKYEIFGMVLLEAMYFEKVVLTTENGGSSMLISDGVDGFILKDASAEAWAEKICALRRNPQQMQEIGQRASEKIARNFTWDALADSFIEEYRCCIK